MDFFFLLYCLFCFFGRGGDGTCPQIFHEYQTFYTLKFKQKTKTKKLYEYSINHESKEQTDTSEILIHANKNADVCFSWHSYSKNVILVETLEYQ